MCKAKYFHTNQIAFFYLKEVLLRTGVGMNGRAIVCPLKELSKDHDWTRQVFPVSCIASGLDFSEELRLVKKARNIVLKRIPGKDPVEAACTQYQPLTHRTFHNLRSQFGNFCISSSQLGKETTFPRPRHWNIKVIYFQTKELGNVNFKALRLTLTHLLETDGI